MMGELIPSELKPKTLETDTNEACPVCEHHYDFVEVISVEEYTEDIDRRPVCTRISEGGLIEIYHHESLIGGDILI